jgi:Tol biopolymer transport system component
MKRMTSFGAYTDYPAVSPDGTLLAYVSDHGSAKGNLSLWVQQVAGDEPIRLSRDDADASEPEFSPDGTRIAFRWEHNPAGIYLVPTLGSSEPKLLVQGGRFPKFSPDGKLLAYWTGPNISGDPVAAGLGAVWVVPASGGELRRILSDFSWAGYPLWLPDGKRLLVEGVRKVDVDPNVRWWVAPIDGGKPADAAFSMRIGRPVGGALPGTPVIAETVDPQGRTFFAVSSSGNTDLWTVRLSDGGRAQLPAIRLTSQTEVVMHPSATRDHHIVFSSVKRNESLWTLPVDANAGITLSDPRFLREGGSEGPSILMDGSKMVFSSDRSGQWNVWIRDMQTGDEQPLTTASEPIMSPLFSPDGSTVLGWASSTNDRGLFAVPASGGPMTKVGQCGRPWSWIAEGVLCASPEQPRGVLLLNLAAREKRSVLSHPSYNLYHARTSPDGRWVSFGATVDPDHSRIFVAPSGGSEPIPQTAWIAITDGSFRDSHAVWSPNSQLLYFLSNRDGFRCVWAQRLDSVTKQPSGSAFPVLHMHEARHSLMIPETELAVAKGVLILVVGEFSGDIWLARIEE